MNKSSRKFVNSALALSMISTIALNNVSVFAQMHSHAHEEELTNNPADDILNPATLEDEVPEISQEYFANFTVNTEYLDTDKMEQIPNEQVVGTADIDEDDPLIQTVEEELENIVVTAEDGTKVGLTDEQKATVLGMYQEYVNNWNANKDVLGVQLPFYLSYNDKNDDLGVLGEMLVLANVSVDMVRNGDYSYDDLTGMITNFLFGDMLGVQFYGNIIRNKRDEAMQAVKNSGAVTEQQKLLVLNDWLATVASFDMSYIMNTGKEEPVMAAQNPQNHQYQQQVYQAIYNQYEGQIEDQFYGQLEEAIVAQLTAEFWNGAIKDIYTQAIAQQILESMQPEPEPEPEPTSEEPGTEEVPENPADPDNGGTTVEPDAPENGGTTDESGDPVNPEPENPGTGEDTGATEEPGNTEDTGTTEDETTDSEGGEVTDPEVTPDEETNPTPDEETVDEFENEPVNADEIPAEILEAAAAQADQILARDAEAIAADPAAYAAGAFGPEVGAMLEAEYDKFMEAARTTGVEVDPVNDPGHLMNIDQLVAQTAATQKILDVTGDGQPDLTADEAIPVFADQAAQGLSQGVLNYWKGNHIGALAEGASVCLGYAKAYAYLVQVMHPEIYGKNGANTDMTVSANWKDAADLYFDANGNIDINKNYAVDIVRITFDTDVTMYGETQEGFNSDHFWNAVKVNGKWYYVDPCYTDTFSEVMIRDRVETDGYVNHLYFMFSHSTAAQLYDGYYSLIKTLYSDVATDKTYENVWFSRAVSNVYTQNGDAYYVYDSTNLINQLEMSNSQNMNQDLLDELMADPEYKLVKHTMSSNDSKDGDSDYDDLIQFNYKANEDDETTVARVYNPTSRQMEENELLTKMFAQHRAMMDVYPSINITTFLSGNKLFFNLHKYICSYDLSTGEVKVHKSYDRVGGKRDLTKAFGGMAFNMVSYGSGDFNFVDHPIAGMVLKSNGDLVVSIATNLGYISGKDDGVRNLANGDYTADNAKNGYGYEFEESNYNPTYNSYASYDQAMMESFGYSADLNDNDEFMWVANFVGKENLSSIVNGTAEFHDDECVHHWLPFNETYFTKNDAGQWNTGTSYVCAIDGVHVSEPQEPSQNGMMTDEEYQQAMAEYEEKKAEFDAIAASAGHIYDVTDAKWSDDFSTVTFSKLEDTSGDADRAGKVDLIPNANYKSVTLKEAVTVEAEEVITGTCEEGLLSTFTAKGQAEGNNFVVSTTKQHEAGVHLYDVTFEWSEDLTSAKATAICAYCGKEDVVDAVVTKVEGEHVDATCTTDGHAVYEAVAQFKEGDKVVHTATERQEMPLAMLGHSKLEGVKLTWSDDFTSAVAEGTCPVCGETVTMDAVVTVEQDVENTCEEDGIKVIHAEATFINVNGEEIGFVEDTKTFELKATGHDFHAGECANCGMYHSPFTDVQRHKDHATNPEKTIWYHDHALTANERSLITGTKPESAPFAGDGEFAPYANLTRGQIMVILYRMAGEPEVDSTRIFTDVNPEAPGHYFAKAVTWGYQNGIANGYNPTEEGVKFGPSDPVTRQQLATILYNFATWAGYDTSARADLSSFPDAYRVQDYALNAMQWCVAEKLISGVQVNGVATLAPFNTATRGQAAKLIVELDNLLGDMPKEMAAKQAAAKEEAEKAPETEDKTEAEDQTDADVNTDAEENSEAEAGTEEA